ncbi:AzlD domain-containing protein [Enterobacter sp.]|uniref:AzlD domain-containing protein n=1 Tax=Enterobacter sp. TaxID=42895 RepID=UPI00296EE257|nr:AzlD domain-containing protein [Enterobacter sp.]
MDRNIILAIALVSIVTAAMRVLPLLLLSRMRLSFTLQQWLAFIPSGIMTAIVVTELLQKPAMTASGLSVSLLAAIVATLVGALTRSLFATVISGMVAFSVLQLLSWL